MELKGYTIKWIESSEGMLLTQSADVPAIERIFSSKVYDCNPDNWVEWSIEDVDKFIVETKSVAITIQHVHEYDEYDEYDELEK